MLKSPDSNFLSTASLMKGSLESLGFFFSVSQLFLFFLLENLGAVSSSDGNPMSSFDKISICF